MDQPIKSKSFIKRFWWLIVLIVILTAGGLVYQNRPELNSDNNGQIKPTSSTKNQKISFTHKMFETEKVTNILPLGELNGGYVELQTLNGVMVQLDKEKIIETGIEVYAPTEMELYMYAQTATADRPEGDWNLDFRINNNVGLTIHHLNNAAEKITSVIGNTPTRDDSRGINIQNTIKFKAGDLIGTTKGTSLGANWNIYVYDKSVKNQFVNQKRYENGGYLGERLLSSTCVFDYYIDQTIKDSYYTLLGATEPGQTTSCGSPTKDKIGTLSGLWHLKKDGLETNYDGEYATPFSIYKRSDGNIIIYELGKRSYTIAKGEPSAKSPEEVTTTHCYNLADDWDGRSIGYAYFRIDSELEMSVTYSSIGSCPAEFPDGQAKKYYR